MAKVKYLRHSEIENATLCLLAEYGRKYGDVVEPPVPVEEILEAMWSHPDYQQISAQ
jgi:hypothetical protein